MKIIHVPFCFHPDPVGGTEVYVHALAKRLQERGIDTIIAAPAIAEAAYVHDGLSIRRFRVVEAIQDVRDLYDEGDSQAAKVFGQILEEEQPDLVHLHALTRSVSLRLVRVSRARGIPVIFTYHTPTVSCQRGTLLRWGKDVCHGRLDAVRCASCTLHGLGVFRPLADVLGRIPAGMGRRLGGTGRRGDAWTALQMRAWLEIRHAALRALWTEVDHIVAVTEWVRTLLMLNGVPARKITLSQHGLAQTTPSVNSTLPIDPSRPLHLAFVGRFHPTKGLHTLVEAIRSAPRLSLSLDVYGVTQSPADQQYSRQVQMMVHGDRRMAFCHPLATDQVVDILQGYDLLAVPSQGMESGPLVVLEAFAAGTPVLGSRLGGIAELVTHDCDGWLVEPGAPEAWREALQMLSEDRRIVSRLRAGIRPPRIMATVAEEMITLYRSVLQGTR